MYMLINSYLYYFGSSVIIWGTCRILKRLFLLSVFPKHYGQNKVGIERKLQTYPDFPPAGCTLSLSLFINKRRNALENKRF